MDKGPGEEPASQSQKSGIYVSLKKGRQPLTVEVNLKSDAKVNTSAKAYQ